MRRSVPWYLWLIGGVLFLFVASATAAVPVMMRVGFKVEAPPQLESALRCSNVHSGCCARCCTKGDFWSFVADFELEIGRVGSVRDRLPPSAPTPPCQGHFELKLARQST